MEKQKKVLLVDDEEEFVNSLAERLRIRDLDSDTAYNGEQALAYINNGCKPDVMVLDLRMTGMGGMEVLRETRKTHPGIQVIMLSGHGSRNHQDEAMRLGAFDYLQKPVNIDMLMSKITKAYEKKAHEDMTTVGFAEDSEPQAARDSLKGEE